MSGAGIIPAAAFREWLAALKYFVSKPWWRGFAARYDGIRAVRRTHTALKERNDWSTGLFRRC